MQDKLKGSFDSETMAMLTRVLDEALKASMGFRHAPLNDAELQNLNTRLGRVIVSASCMHGIFATPKTRAHTRVMGFHCPMSLGAGLDLLAPLAVWRVSKASVFRRGQAVPLPDCVPVFKAGVV